MFESQRFKLGGNSTVGSLWTLFNDDELCVHAKAPGGSIQIVPCKSKSSVTAAATSDTTHWRLSPSGQHDSIVGFGGAFDGKCLTTFAPLVDKRSYIAKMAKDCDSADPSQKWEFSSKEFGDDTAGGASGGGTLCHPTGTSAGTSVNVGAVDVGCLSFVGGFNPPVTHLYPAVRDVKAAVRWLRAEGAARFNVDTSFLTLDGGSAGACAILGAGLAQEQGDFTSEVSEAEDPTLRSTHLGVSDSVRSMIVHWGAPFGVDIATSADPKHRSRYHRGAQPSIIAYSGLVDTTVCSLLTQLTVTY